MKKSLLIAPVLGILLVAAAGSVGGTVAWFSSVNTFNTEISSFAVGRVEGALNVTMAADRGTVKVGDAIAVGKLAAGDSKLTHGSFDHTIATVGDDSVCTLDEQSISATTTVSGGAVSLDRTKFLSTVGQVEGSYLFTYTTSWACTHASTTTTPTGGSLPSGISTEVLGSTHGITLTGSPQNGDTITVAVSNSYKVDEDWMHSTVQHDSKYWYYAVSWKMTFAYEFGADTTSRNVYLNVATSAATNQPSNDYNDSLLQTQQGFRIAFHNGTTRNLIWAPNQANVAQIHYVDASTPATAEYPDDDATVSLWNKGDAAVVSSSEASGGIATVSANKNYICTLSSGTPSVQIYCVAWYEGTDPNVANAASMDNVKAALNFFALPAAA